MYISIKNYPGLNNEHIPHSPKLLNFSVPLYLTACSPGNRQTLTSSLSPDWSVFLGSVDILLLGEGLTSISFNIKD